jgi:hypothetical protein
VQLAGEAQLGAIPLVFLQVTQLVELPEHDRHTDEQILQRAPAWKKPIGHSVKQEEPK